MGFKMNNYSLIIKSYFLRKSIYIPIFLLILAILTFNYIGNLNTISVVTIQTLIYLYASLIPIYFISKDKLLNFYKHLFMRPSSSTRYIMSHILFSLIYYIILNLLLVILSFVLSTNVDIQYTVEISILRITSVLILCTFSILITLLSNSFITLIIILAILIFSDLILERINLSKLDFILPIKYFDLFDLIYHTDNRLKILLYSIKNLSYSLIFSLLTIKILRRRF